MRILWHSAAPWEGTGYGQQTNIWTKHLTANGHHVAISAYHGGQGETRDWNGIAVYGPPLTGYSTGLLAAHARKHKADAIICLADVWLMDPQVFGDYPALCWTPVDAAPLSLGDTNFFVRRAGANVHPVAMSEFGYQTMKDAGLLPGYVPHAIDTTVFKPEQHRAELRTAYGIEPDEFAIGINANNIDPVRKAYAEQFHAFAELLHSGVKATMFVHSIVDIQGSLNLLVLAQTLGIRDRVRFADQYRMQTGAYTAEEVARWYCAMDVVSNATYGEGFGLPAVEAQACGTPVILSDGSTGPQLVGPGWLVKTEPYWNPVHNSWWHRPSTKALLGAYKDARRHMINPLKRRACVQFASKYDILRIGAGWLDILEGLEHGAAPAA